MVYWHQVRISNRRQGIGPQIYWGHDLDLSGSREVIIHVTIRIQMGHFLLVVHRPLDPSLYLHPFSRYLALSILRHDLDLSGSDDVIGHVTI